MIPEHIVKLAMENGYKNLTHNFIKIEKRHNQAVMALDPLFWQALGKAKKWYEKYDAIKEKTYALTGGLNMPKAMYEWRRQSSKFFDLLMTNGDITVFWANLK